MTRTKSVKALLCVLLSMTLIIAFMPQTANVYAASAKKVTKITKVTSKASKYTMTAGTSKTFQVKLYPKNLTKSARTTYVSTSKKSVAATYSKKYKKTKYGYTYVSFKVKAVKAGTATVTAKAKSGKKVKWKITVKAAPVAVKTVAISNFSTGVDTAIAQGNILKATVAPAGAAVSYQWYTVDAAGTATAISGATEQTYKITGADANKQLKVVVKGTGNYTGTAEATTTAKVTATAITGASIFNLDGSTVTMAAIGVAVKAVATPLEAAVVSYQWYRSGYAIDGATEATYTPTLADKGPSTLSVRVTGYDATGKTNVVESNPSISVGENLATSTTAKITLAAAAATVAITTNPVAPATTGTPVTVATAKWYIDSVSDATQLYTDKYVKGASQTAAGTATLDTTAAKAYYLKDATTATSLLGHKLICVATSTDYGGSVTSAVSDTVTDKISTLTIKEDTVAVGTELTAELTTEKSATKDITATYQWYRGLTPIAGATSAKYTPTSADAGATIGCTVTGTGNYTGTKQLQLTNTVSNAALSVAVKSVSLGTALVATTTPAVAASDVTYQWYKDSVGAANVISGATSATYTPATAGTYAVEVTVKTGVTAYSNTTANTTATVGKAITSVSLSTKTTTGDTLAATLAPTGLQAAQYIVAWYLDNTAAANRIGTENDSSPYVFTAETGLTLELNKAFVLEGNKTNGTVPGKTTSIVGHKIICVVTGVGDYVGSEVKATSGTVTGALGAIGYDTAATTVGTDVTATMTGYTLGTDYTLQWYVGGNKIVGATAAKYTLAASDLGKVVTAVATGMGNYTGADKVASTDITVTAKTVALAKSVETATVGTAVSVTVDPAVAASDFNFQWYTSAGVELTGETSATHTLTTADAESGVYCEVTVKTGASGAYKLPTTVKHEWTKKQISQN